MTVNAAYKNAIGEEEIAELIKNKVLLDKYIEHMYVFFTEVPVSVINKFIKHYSISIYQLKDYYETFIKPVYQNKDLEEMFSG
jgi:hypothetical protein